MKRLVIFYSFDGNTRLIAKTISSSINADILELKPEKEINRFFKYLVGGKQAMLKAKPKLVPFENNLEKYDVIFIGTPVWAGTFAPSLNTFFADKLLLNKKIALFCCHRGGMGKIFNKMKKELENNTVLGEIDFEEPLQKNRDINVKKAIEWSKNILSKI